MKPEQIEALKALAEKATPGPWLSPHRDSICAKRASRDAIIFQFWTPPNPKDREFMLASVNSIPALIASLEAERARAEKAEAKLKEAKRVIVDAAIPLEALQISGAYKLLSLTGQNEINGAVASIRAFLSSREAANETR